MNINKTKHIILKSNVSGVVPTIPIVSNHTQPGWIPTTDIYEGEMFLNTADQALYTRAGSTIIQINGSTVSRYLDDMIDVDAATPSNADILTYDRTNWISKQTFDGVLNVDETLRSVYQEGCILGALAARSFATGLSTYVGGSYGHSEGAGTSASNYAHAEGQNTTASGDISHSEGNQTTASGDISHSEGNQTIASGTGAHSEGLSTLASGAYSAAFNVLTQATGNYSAAFNSGSIASGASSFAIGYGGNSSRNTQFSQGNTSFGAAGDTSFNRIMIGEVTTDAIVTTLYTFNTETNHIYSFRFHGIGVVKTGTNPGAMNVYGPYSSATPENYIYIKNIGGTVSISPVDKINALGDGHGSDATFPGNDIIQLSKSGTDIIFSIQGAASTRIYWIMDLEWIETII